MVSICENQDQFKLSTLLHNIHWMCFRWCFKVNSEYLKPTFSQMAVETNGRPNLTSTNVLSLKVMSGLKLSWHDQKLPASLHGFLGANDSGLLNDRPLAEGSHKLQKMWKNSRGQRERVMHFHVQTAELMDLFVFFFNRNFLQVPQPFILLHINW